jgi:hypothetical protein
VRTVIWVPNAIIKGSQKDGESTFWIRRSTGRLCVELVPSNTSLWSPDLGTEITGRGITSLDAPAEEAMVIDSLTLDQYHKICYWILREFRSIFTSAPLTVSLGAIMSWSSTDQLEDLVEIASLPDVQFIGEGWCHEANRPMSVMEDGWTRYYFFPA